MLSEKAKFMSPYRRGADDGYVMGAYFTAMFLAFFYQLRFPELAMLVLLMGAGVPAVVYMRLRRSFRCDGLSTPLSSLWMEGIVMFLCGSLLSGCVALVMMKFVEPGWLSTFVAASAEALRDNPHPSAPEVAEALDLIIERRMLPPAPVIVFESVWMAVLSGSLLSLIVAVMLRAGVRQKRPL